MKRNEETYTLLKRNKSLHLKGLKVAISFSKSLCHFLVHHPTYLFFFSLKAQVRSKAASSSRWKWKKWGHTTSRRGLGHFLKRKEERACCGASWGFEDVLGQNVAWQASYGCSTFSRKNLVRVRLSLISVSFLQDPFCDHFIDFPWTRFRFGKLPNYVFNDNKISLSKLIYWFEQLISFLLRGHTISCVWGFFQ